jgi:YidC/Oxa1 family membrane protein insertase
MEKRLLLAIVLSFLILFLYQAVFVKKGPQAPPEPESRPAAEQPVTAEPAARTQTESPPDIQTEKPDPDLLQPVSGESERRVQVETSLYEAVWSNRGAGLLSWRLKQHVDDNGNPLELISLRASETGVFPFFLRSEDPEFDQAANAALYRTTGGSLNLSDGREGRISFEFVDENGIRVEKTFTFRDGSYGVGVEIKAWNNGIPLEPRIIWGPQIGNPDPEQKKSRFGGSNGATIYSGTKVVHVEERKYDPEKSAFTFVNWAAYDDQYFAALFLTDPQNSSALFIQQPVNEVLNDYFLAVNHVHTAYIGPKSFDRLSALGFEAKKLVRFGFFGVVTEVLYFAIKAVHNAIPNWGISIILITLVIKILFFPLTYSSTKSMSKMQELQPKLKALKNKYKKAKQDIEQRRKLNEETMRLYKEHGVNPAGGCLPMLIQLPIFWGFFRLLVVAIEFRHAPFVFWLQDLSVRDPYYITPILMGITQFISQKMTPTSGDSTQQKMMLIMPVVMTVFFMNFQSGLVLYWLTNNVLQIAQQAIMNRFMQKKKRESHGKRNKK